MSDSTLPSTSKIAAGVLAGATACLIGAGAQVVIRYGVTTDLAPIDLALVRFLMPGLVLAPLWLRIGLLPRGVSPIAILMMVVGGGLPFSLIMIAGARFAPVAHMAVFLQGVMPLMVGALAVLFERERLGSERLAGYGLILAGVLCLSYLSLTDLSIGTWRGDLLFLAAALAWAVYSVAMRRAGLSPWASTAVVNGWSMLLVAPVWLVFQEGTLPAADPADVALQVVWLGCINGLLGLWVYAYAVATLGSVPASAMGASVPVLSAVGGWLVLGETVTGPGMVGIVLTSLGVAVSSGALGALRRRAP